MLSDSNITPLLTMLGAAELASRRPYWGSTLVFELWQQEGGEPGVTAPFNVTENGRNFVFQGQLENHKKRFQDTPKFEFPTVFDRIEPFHRDRPF